VRGGAGTDEVDERCRLLVPVAVGERVRAAVVLPRAAHAVAEARAAPSGGRGAPAEATKALLPLHLGDERRLHFRHRSLHLDGDKQTPTEIWNGEPNLGLNYYASTVVVVEVEVEAGAGAGVGLK